MSLVVEDTGRFAVYFTFPQYHALYQKAAQWLGHCVYSGSSDVTKETIEFSKPLENIRSVQQAAQYGFHATLKPPFRLKSGVTRPELEESVADFASGLNPFNCAPLKVASLGHFIALIPSEECEAVNYLARQSVEKFEPFRAPLNKTEMQKRLQSQLTSRQKHLLDRWGYPYVLDEFRFHMTLTDRLPHNVIENALCQLEYEFSPLLNSPLQIDRICIFHQKKTGASFHLIQSYLLGDKCERSAGSKQDDSQYL